jgi:hypothetical protein
MVRDARLLVYGRSGLYRGHYGTLIILPKILCRRQYMKMIDEEVEKIYAEQGDGGSMRFFKPCSDEDDFDF